MSKFKKCLKCAVQNTKAKKTVSAHNLFSEKSHKLTAVWLHKLVALVAKRALKPIDQPAALEKISFFFWGVCSNGVEPLFSKCIQEAT